MALKIVYPPFINHEVELLRCEGPDFDGNFTIIGKVNGGKEARLVLTAKDGAKLEKWMRDGDATELAKTL